MPGRLKNLNDIINKQFGKLTVKQHSKTTESITNKGVKVIRYYYLCTCDCGSGTKEIARTKLITGRVVSCGICVRKLANVSDIVGKKIGKLDVIRFSREVRNRFGNLLYYYICTCECNPAKEIEKVRGFLLSGKATSCGCSRHGKESKLWQGFEYIPNKLWDGIKKHSKLRNIELDITIADAWEQFKKQDGKCTLTGLKLMFNTTHKKRDGTASLDRVDSDKGYTKNNIQWIYKDLNKLKWTFTQDKFIFLCKSVANPILNSTPLQELNFGVDPYHGNKRGNQSVNWKGFGEISGYFWGKVITMAKNKKLDFSISVEDAWNLFKNQNRRCAITKLPISFAINFKSRNSRTASLDRIDNSKGYTINNVQWVHKDINWLKGKLNQKKLVELCKLVAVYNQ